MTAIIFIAAAMRLRPMGGLSVRRVRSHIASGCKSSATASTSGATATRYSGVSIPLFDRASLRRAVRRCGRASIRERHDPWACKLRDRADSKSRRLAAITLINRANKKDGISRLFYLGRIMGIEPTTSGTTTRRSNQLSYIRQTVSYCSTVTGVRLEVLQGFDFGPQ
jgi:hypothetical protein